MGYCPLPLRPLPDDLPPRREPPADDWPPHLRDNPQPFGCLWVATGFAAVVMLMAMLSSRIMQEPIPVPEKPAVRAEMEGE